MASPSNPWIKRLQRVLNPRHKFARFTTWLGILTALCWIADLPAGASLGFWAILLTLVFSVCALICFYRWGYRHEGTAAIPA